MRQGNGSIPTEVERVAFDLLLVDVQRRLTSRAYTLTKNIDQARDLVQDTMVRALEFQHQFHEGTSFLAWTTVIMRNLFFNRFRQVRKQEKADAAVIRKMSIADYTKNSASGFLDATLELKKVLRCFHALPKSINRDALDLVILKEKSLEEAAAIMHICPVTVRTRMLRGRDALLRKYDPETATIKIPSYRAFRYPHAHRAKPDANRIRELRLQKCSLKDIATDMHISVSSVRASIRDLHLANPSISESVKRSWVQRRERLKRYYG